MVANRAGHGRLRVIKGGADDVGGKSGAGDRPLNLVLLLLALFLLAQVLLGWVLGSIHDRSGNVIIAAGGSVDVSLPSEGILTFDEELVFTPQPGFVRYCVNDGERVAVGRELAVVTAFLGETSTPGQGNGPAGEDYLQRFRSWLLEDRDAADQMPEDFLPVNRMLGITAPRAGLVSRHIDGWEIYGPGNAYIYLDSEDYLNRTPAKQPLSPGEQIARFAPILKIIDNYRWYYSTVIPSSPGKQIAEQDHVRLAFSFAPEHRLLAKKVETGNREGGGVEITWAIDQEVGDYYNRRWCTAEITYDSLQGVLIPCSTLLDRDGCKGVFVVEKGIVVFREMIILAEEDDYVLVENLDPFERVIAQPGRVKEGQHFL